MAETFRLVPPAVRSSWIDRPRLTRLLAQRFDVDVLVVDAPAGYGKTSALGLALAANEDQHLGVDLWLQCEPQDRDADAFARGILAAAGLPAPGAGFTATADKLADALLRFAPLPVCLVLDDVHVLTPGSAGVRLLAQLLELLPAHGHLLLCGRSPPPVRLARRRALGQSVEIGVDDLAFDAEEVDLVFPGHEHRDADVVRWPAMASLLAAGSADATVDFLLEEVAGAFGTDRLATLTALSQLRTVDDGIARAASDGASDAADLLGELPLVQRTAEGAFQMHDLWRDALVHGPLDRAASAALCRVADHLVDRARHLEAAELFLVAGDRGGFERSVRAFAGQPLMVLNARDLHHFARLTSEQLPGRALTAVLAAAIDVLGDERTSAAEFEAAAEQARGEGDRRAEALALQFATNMRGVVNPFAFPPVLTERAAALAGDGDPFGISLHALLSSHDARAAGEPEAAVAHLAALSPSTSLTDRVQHAFAMSDLGRPEEVGTPDAGDLADQAGGEYLGQAVWLRGEVSPELALAIGRAMADASDARHVPHVQISVNSVLSLIGCAAGDAEAARDFADRAARWLGHTASDYVRAFAGLADAATVLLERGEDDARERVQRLVDGVPVEPWPFRAYLYALPLLYVLDPRTRATIDRCRFGPALTVAQQAGRALVALREADDPSPAFDLPWHRVDLLRVHMLPPHLTQLAAAAAAAGHGAVGEVLDHLPSVRDHLVDASRLGHAPTASWARLRAEELPARPEFDLRLDVLGPVRAARGLTPLADEAWTRRERVRQLMAYLVQQRRVTRRRAAEELWPDMPVERALQNLRVNLSHLQRVLQPNRDTGEEPWFVRAKSDQLEVTSIGLDVDADRFERSCREARRWDEQAQGTRAIEGYRNAAELFRGDYLEEWPDAAWAASDRVRLRTLATTSICRLGELLLARGEPEEATAWASTAQRLEPLLERAHRLFIRGLAGQGNRPAAMEAAATFVERLEADGLTPEPETVRFVEGLGGRPAG